MQSNSDLLQRSRAERRRTRRTRVLKGGQIVLREDRRVTACHILDVSEHGARLRAPEATACPTSFMLDLGSGAARACETVWTSGDMLGVRFP